MFEANNIKYWYTDYLVKLFSIIYTDVDLLPGGQEESVGEAESTQ